jgi:hypothetical protein
MANRATVACPECGREMTSNNIARHVATHSNGTMKGTAKAKVNGSGKRMGRPAGPLSKKQLTNFTMSKTVGRYLDLLADESEYGRSGTVRLGRLEGFPAATNDPDVVEAAAAMISQTADETTSRIRELELRQRVLDLRAMAEELREGTALELEEAFVKVAAVWAAERGITYAAFREMGVTARVLKAAGIAP